MKWLKSTVTALLLICLLASSALAGEPEVPENCTYDGEITVCMTVIIEGPEKPETEHRQAVVRLLGCTDHYRAVGESRTVTYMTVTTLIIVKAGSPWDLGPIIEDSAITERVMIDATDWVAVDKPFVVGNCGKR